MALRLEREVDLHDGVLLDDADEQNEADERVDVQLVVKGIQREERAEPGGRQARKNRERVDVALVERAEHDVDDADRHEQQQAEVAHRLLECLGLPLEARRRPSAAASRSATSLTRAVAAPSETPGLRPKDTDTDGSWPEWLIDCGPTVSL